VLHSDLILRKMTEGSLGADPRASDIWPLHRNTGRFRRAQTAFRLGPIRPPISGTKIAHWFDCELASPTGADS